MPSAISYQLHTDTPHGFEHIEIEHDGSINWLEMQTIKNEVWGRDAIAIEMYPPQDRVVNGGSTEFHYRHLFKMNDDFAWPDIRGDW